MERLSREGVARGLFVLEADAARIHETLLARLPRFTDLPESRRRAVAAVNRACNLWLQGETERRGLVSIPSQPWDSLARRAAEALAGRPERA